MSLATPLVMGFISRRESTDAMSIPSHRWVVCRLTSQGLSVSSHRRSSILGRVRTGILGGTFDPIHIAHLHAGEVSLSQADLDRVLFIPAGDPWQKSDRPVTAAAHRLVMVELATAGVDGFEADDREIVRDGPTYTVDTLSTFPADEELFLILGADSALGLITWHRYQEILDRATILVVPRPGTDSVEVISVVPEATFLDMSVLEISGTEIRAMAAHDEPFRFLVTGAVHSYIQNEGVYPKTRNADSVSDSQELEESS